MAVRYKSYGLQEFFEKIDENRIVLPDFQRGYVWTEEQQRNLIASVLVDLPIGSTLHIEGTKDDFTARAICEQKEIIPREECEYLLDGQQRISTLYNTFKDVYSKAIGNWMEIWKNLFQKIKYRWFIKVELGERDIFGYEKLLFDEKKAISLEPRDVKNIIISKKILKTKDIDKWYHPNFRPKDSSENEFNENRAKLEIARLAAAENLIPLYELYKKEDGIHRQVLDELAIKRLRELKEEVKDGNYSVEKVLGKISPEIEDLKDDPEKIEKLWDKLQVKWVEKVSIFLENLLGKKIPIILLPKDEIGRAAAIFEEINKGGTPLSNFDLIIAKVARVVSREKEKSLVQTILDILNEEFPVEYLDTEVRDWRASLFTSTQENLPSKKFQTIFLNALSIIANESKVREITKSLISRKTILDLEPEDIVNYTEKVTRAIARSFAFLQLRCGHINESVISYDYMVLPIVYLFYHDSVWEDRSKIDKIEAWFWSSLFSGAYRDRQDDQFIKDLKALKAWLINEDLEAAELREVGWIEEEGKVRLNSYTQKLFSKEEYSDKDTLLHTNKNSLPPTAVRNSILQYILSGKPLDFMPQNPQVLTAYKGSQESPKLVIHHIIPLSSVTKIGESTKALRKDKENVLNSPLNLTYISDEANSKIRDKRIDEYFEELTGFQINTHLFPSDIKERPCNEEEIRKILSGRFDLLRSNVVTRINSLLNS